MKSSRIIQGGSKSNNKCSYERHREDREESHVKMEADIGIMQPQAKDHLEPPAARRPEEGFSP